MSLKQPTILLVFDEQEDSNIVNKLTEKHEVFTTTLEKNDFHSLISTNHIHVYITIGDNWEKFGSIFNKYGNKLLKKWIHKTNEEALNQDISACAINVFFSSSIVDIKNEMISYYVTAYNSGELIYRPYNSLLQQTYKNWEMVIIDDSEEDNKTTENIVKTISNNDLRVKYFRMKHSGFIGEVKNHAARLCKGYIICELDHDDEIVPELTMKLHEVYKDNNVIFVSSNCCELYDDNQENVTYGEHYDFGYGSYSYEWNRGKWRAVSQAGDMNITTVTDIVGVPNHIRTWRASALFELGYNNPDLYVADDYELMLRTINYCSANNKTMMHLPILGYYQYRNRNIGNHTFKRNHQIRSLQSLSHKFYKDKIAGSISTLQERYYPGILKQRCFDNYDGPNCITNWTMPWNWKPQNINQHYYEDDFTVSIVISTYKRSELLIRAINSCLSQTYQKFEIIIVGDKCPELENTMNNFSGPKEKIRWWNLYSNSKDGGTTPKNYALRTCVRTNLVCYLDDDNIYTPTHLETLIDKFKSNSKLGFAFSSMEMGAYKIICKEPKKMRVDTSTFMHKRTLLDKYGYWRKHSDAGYCHDYEIVSRWVAGRESWAATEQVTMIYNMETQSLNNPRGIYLAYNDQLPLGDNECVEPQYKDTTGDDYKEIIDEINTLKTRLSVLTKENTEDEFSKKNAIFITVFNQEKYVEMLGIMLQSVHTYGELDTNTDILIYTSTVFMNKIKESSFMSDRIVFEINDTYDNIDKACKARLDLFELQSVSKYSKILYLDTDIIIKGDLNVILNLALENKIYALEECTVDYITHGSVLFKDDPISYNSATAFSSGIMLFNNCFEISNLFKNIKQDIVDRAYNFITCDQPYIVYNAFKYNLHNNKLMKLYCINNDHNINSNKIIHHFPGGSEGPGVYANKMIYMIRFLDELKQKNALINKEFTWESSSITFLKDNKMDAFGEGKYEYINSNTIKAFFGYRVHIIEFNSDFTAFKSTRCDDLEIINGSIIDPSKIISKIIMQTSKVDQKLYVKNMIMNKCIGYEYLHFVDDDIIDFFNNNAIDEFPNIINVFNSFTLGQHKADLFRYYFLYLKGGVFIDSDAILEENIDVIIGNFDSIFVKSFCNNTHLFNGFICTYPKSQIIYEALKHAYNTDNSVLMNSYHHLCEELLRIFDRLKLPNMKIYQEIDKTQEGYGGSIIVNDNGRKILSHYWQSKIIPNVDHLKEEFTKIYDENFWVNGSGSGSYIKNTAEYNKYLINFIKDNNITTVTDIGCGDWQSSYLIYDNLENIDYLGIDCVDSVIDRNIINHPKYKFLSLNILNNLDKIRDSELFVIKDVLQHWKLKDIYTLLDFLTTQKKFRYILITNNGNQFSDNLELDHYIGIGRGLHSNYLPLKKYNAINFHDYFEDENKHMCLITFIDNFENSGFDTLLVPYNKTEWNNYNKNEINEFDYTVLIIHKIPNNLIRIGPTEDGGYIVADGLTYDLFISCGIANDVRFEEAFLDSYPNLKCFAFDGTIDRFPNHRNTMAWVNKNIGYINTNKITNLREYICDHNNIFLKMDIEGSEFNWIDCMSKDELNKFSQIVMEIHWPFDIYRCNMLKKLADTHYAIHIHGNNYCSRDIPKHLPSGRSYDGTVIINNENLPSIFLPEVFEITYVRKDLFDKSLVSKINFYGPTPLDFPNNSHVSDISFSIIANKCSIVKMDINIFALCFNEALIIPHMVAHYRKYLPSCKITIYDNESTDNSVEIAKALGCTVISWSSNNKFDDNKNLEIKNNCWKQVKNGWIIVTDMDEFLCVNENELLEETKLGTTILNVSGLQMIGESSTEDLSDIDLQNITKYIPNEYESKKLCFYRDNITEMNYSPGAHSCNPKGDRIQFSSNHYFNKHMCFLGLRFLINRYIERFKRSKEQRSLYGYSSHYTDDIMKISDEYNKALLNCKTL